MLDDGCTCFKSAPCDFCLSLTEEEADVIWNGGIKALKKFRAKQEMLATMTSVEQDFMKEMMERGESVFNCGTIAIIPLRIPYPKDSQYSKPSSLDLYLDSRSILFCDPDNPSQSATIFNMPRSYNGLIFPDTNCLVIAAIMTLAGYDILLPVLSGPLPYEQILIGDIGISKIALSLYDPTTDQSVIPVFFDECITLLLQPVHKSIIDHMIWRQTQALDISENGGSSSGGGSTGPDGLQTLAKVTKPTTAVKPASQPFASIHNPIPKNMFAKYMEKLKNFPS